MAFSQPSRIWGGGCQGLKTRVSSQVNPPRSWGVGDQPAPYLQSLLTSPRIGPPWPWRESLAKSTVGVPVEPLPKYEVPQWFDFEPQTYSPHLS